MSTESDPFQGPHPDVKDAPAATSAASPAKPGTKPEQVQFSASDPDGGARFRAPVLRPGDTGISMVTLEPGDPESPHVEFRMHGYVITNEPTPVPSTMVPVLTQQAARTGVKLTVTPGGSES